MILVHKIHVFELQIKTNKYDPRSVKRYLTSGEKGPKNSGLNGTRTLTFVIPVQCPDFSAIKPVDSGVQP